MIERVNLHMNIGQRELTPTRTLVRVIVNSHKNIGERELTRTRTLVRERVTSHKNIGESDSKVAQEHW